MNHISTWIQTLLQQIVLQLCTCKGDYKVQIWGVYWFIGSSSKWSIGEGIVQANASLLVYHYLMPLQCSMKDYSEWRILNTIKFVPPYIYKLSINKKNSSVVYNRLYIFTCIINVISGKKRANIFPPLKLCFSKECNHVNRSDKCFPTGNTTRIGDFGSVFLS